METPTAGCRHTRRAAYRRFPNPLSCRFSNRRSVENARRSRVWKPALPQTWKSVARACLRLIVANVDGCENEDDHGAAAALVPAGAAGGVRGGRRSGGGLQFPDARIQGGGRALCGRAARAGQTDFRFRADHGRGHYPGRIHGGPAKTAGRRPGVGGTLEVWPDADSGQWDDAGAYRGGRGGGENSLCGFVLWRAVENYAQSRRGHAGHQSFETRVLAGRSRGGFGTGVAAVDQA